MTPTTLLREVCSRLDAGDKAAATAVLERHYPFVPIAANKRNFSLTTATKISERDGFFDPIQ